MQASILILNWNGLDVLRPCLAAIETNTAGCDYEVIVLDNGSEEQGVEDAVQPYSRVRLIKEPVNHGFSRGNMFSRDGRLVASTVQEGLMRQRATKFELR